MRAIPQFWLKGAVPVLLSTVAVAQMGLAGLGHLSPWKGGGFGMFASVDRPLNRSVVVAGRDLSGRLVAVSVPFGRFGGTGAFSREFLSRLRTFPTERKARLLARAVLLAELVNSTRSTDDYSARLTSSAIYGPPLLALRGDPVVEITSPHRRSAASMELREVQIRVVRLAYDVKAAKVSVVPLVEVWVRSDSLEGDDS